MNSYEYAPIYGNNRKNVRFPFPINSTRGKTTSVPYLRAVSTSTGMNTGENFWRSISAIWTSTKVCLKLNQNLANLMGIGSLLIVTRRRGRIRGRSTAPRLRNWVTNSMWKFIALKIQKPFKNNTRLHKQKWKQQYPKKIQICQRHTLFGHFLIC